MVAMSADVGASPPTEPKLGSTGKPAPRKKILIRKVKPSTTTHQQQQQQKSTTSTGILAQESSLGEKAKSSRGGSRGSRIDFVGGLETMAPCVPRPPPATPPHPASEAAIAPKGPAAGPDGKRPDWAVLGDVGEDCSSTGEGRVLTDNQFRGKDAKFVLFFFCFFFWGGGGYFWLGQRAGDPGVGRRCARLRC